MDAVISSAQIEKKVQEYLRNSRALEDYWQQRISSQLLQAEMERMAQRTKNPEMLRELFGALGVDPFCIVHVKPGRDLVLKRLLVELNTANLKLNNETCSPHNQQAALAQRARRERYCHRRARNHPLLAARLGQHREHMQG